MSQNQNNETTNSWLGDVIRIIASQKRALLTLTLVVALVATVGGAIYMLWLQPVRKSAVLQFRPTFEGAKSGHYPNGLPFGPTDVTATPVLDAVFDRNQILQFCGREHFRAGFFVEQRSMAMAFLEAEYQARLNEARVTAVDRERLLAEYQSKLAAIHLEYRLNFIAPEQCNGIPSEILTKVMGDVLHTWAEDAEIRRGVTKTRASLLTPSSLDVAGKNGQPRLIRADLVRTGIERVIANIAAVQAIPGAELVRLSIGEAPAQSPGTPVRDTRPTVSLAEVRNRMDDLVRSQLEPLIVTAGRSLGRGSASWVEESLSAAVRERETAERRAQVYRDALRLYSGEAAPGGSTGQRTPSSDSTGDSQALTPPIDRPLFDRMVELSDVNTTFRQELTRQLVGLEVTAVNLAGRVRYYEYVKASLGQGPISDVGAESIDATLDAIVAEGKALTQQFNDLYDQISIVAFRPATGLYQVEQPVSQRLVRAFTLQSYLTLVGFALLLTPLLMMLWWFGEQRLAALFAGRR